ncbi:MAG: protein-L-isoaspartate(D-aspartate) O-methyltransferase [Cyclonatronaceae bacterium]
MFHEKNQYKYRNRRKKLLEELRSKGISSEAVLKAIESVPRHLFVDTGFADRAYEDSALPIALGQTISQPFTVARQTELLEVKAGEKILEIGTGSGYQAAILAELGAQVYSVERHRELYHRGQDALREAGYRVMLKCGDGTEGWSAYAPFDGIIVTAGAPVVPEALKAQLSAGGRLVIPVGDGDKQVMYRITRRAEETGEEAHFDEEAFSDFKFVPLIGRQGW